MKKYKAIAICMCLMMFSVCFTACKKDENSSNVVKLPIATANPDITNPQGQYYKVGDELKAEGGLKALGEDFMRVMIEGEEVEFALTENAMREISLYNKDPKNPRICQGTMLLITYTERDLVKFAETMDILTAN